jgi:hypothetical protein
VKHGVSLGANRKDDAIAFVQELIPDLLLAAEHDLAVAAEVSVAIIAGVKVVRRLQILVPPKVPRQVLVSIPRVQWHA